ncbi:Protein of unknown function, DUF547 [Robiginitalea myxolifaciens]|uniref:DUF547 domain-containing protein n=1 Tax=Robiginitalea myxolifaciens TaxID=400055 RepID=A0A1I6H2R1_9FLAO|nr:DUF547 domain-containing protein [Robiginitalea myxolifaciens]SFR48700.1 Protein of unknown function, DUF547 [Robiginitalea myxolifaciens]
MITRFLLCLTLLAAPIFASAQAPASFFEKADAFFSNHVRDGRVDYAAVKANPAALNLLLEKAAAITVSSEDPANYQAFWINAYNLAVIRGIVDHYPVKSPLDIPGFFDKTRYELGGGKYTLNAIENELLRPVYPQEARFHFVLVCAGLGCPPIIPSAYKPDMLEMQLQQQTELALNNPGFIQAKGKRILLSQIFEWYGEDFTRGGKSFIEFINQYRESPLPEKSKTGFYAYDWTLNDVQ